MTMGLFGRKGNPEADLAKALAQRGTLLKVMVEGHVRSRTDVVGGEIVVVEVEDVR
ncbi:MAG TPA: hypothetical protein VGH14_07475 [Solirubrobacterales bacterium]|jgi:hypothetical protein